MQYLHIIKHRGAEHLLTFHKLLILITTQAKKVKNEHGCFYFLISVLSYWPVKRDIQGEIMYDADLDGEKFHTQLEVRKMCIMKNSN